MVTGGAGYVGSHTVHQLLRAGRQVVVLDRAAPSHADVIEDAIFVLGDVGDQDLVEDVLGEHEIESVVHFAGDKDVGESMARPERYFRNNVAGTLSLLTAMANRGCDRLIFSSSCSVYGTPARLPVTEDSPIRPESPYAESKALVERMLVWFERSHGIQSLSLRYFNAAGADFGGRIGEDWGRSQNLIPVVMKAALGVIPVVEVFGTDFPTPDGTAIRDYVHVADLADAHLKGLEYLVAGGSLEAVNLGTGHAASVREVIDMVKKVSGRDVPVRNVGRRAGDPIAVYADNKKARRLLDWAPRFGLLEIIETAWRWHSGRHNPGA